MLQTIIHYSMHFLVIGGIAYWYDKNEWKKAWFILLATMAVDLDHLLVTPVFDADRCSVGFHYLHSFPAIGIYVLGLFFARRKYTRLIFIGLLFHMFTDTVDCAFTFRECKSCWEQSEIYMLYQWF